MTAAKVIFDVRVPDLEKLVFNLQLFNETFDGLVAQGVKPHMLLAFRGPGVKLLTVAALDDDARSSSSAMGTLRVATNCFFTSLI